VAISGQEEPKGALSHKDRIAVFNREGDSICSHSKMTFGNSVKDAYDAIRKDAGLPAAK